MKAIHLPKNVFAYALAYHDLILDKKDLKHFVSSSTSLSGRPGIEARRWLR
jgi:hypothetical protein